MPKWSNDREEILLQVNVLKYLNIKDVVGSLSLVSHKYYFTINENVSLVMLLISYDFGEIFEKCKALTEKLFNRDTTSYQCARLLYTQFDWLHEIGHPDSTLSSAVPTAFHPALPLCPLSSVPFRNDTEDSNRPKIYRDCIHDNVGHKKRKRVDGEVKINKRQCEFLLSGWDFTHLIKWGKSGCILHWLSYVQRLWMASKRCHSPCEIVCDDHGVIQIQPLTITRSHDSNDLAYDEKMVLTGLTNIPTNENKRKSLNSRHKMVLSCALDLWTLCWRKGFTAQELFKLQQGLMQFEFRHW